MNDKAGGYNFFQSIIINREMYFVKKFVAVLLVLCMVRSKEKVSPLLVMQ